MGALRSTSCQVDLESGDVCRDGEVERLPPRLLALLRHLVTERGRIISRDALMTAVWGHMEAASDDSVNVAVSALRRHLGDNARSPRVIETIPRRGYRYTGLGVELADLSALHAGDASSHVASTADVEQGAPDAGAEPAVAATGHPSEPADRVARR